jgi:type IV pilus assembly protein PilB
MTDPKTIMANTRKKSGAQPTNVANEEVQINREFQEKDALRRANELNLPYVNIGKTTLNPDFLRLLDVETAKKGRIVPFYRLGTKLRVAVEDPRNEDTVKTIEALKKQGFEVSPNLCSTSGLEEALKKYDLEKKYKKPELVEKVKRDEVQTYKEELSDLVEIPKKLGSITAEEGLNMLNIGAIRTGASDAHFEPNEESVAVRFRIDGMLHKVFDIANADYDKIAKQIKYKSKMQLNVGTIPQDGRYDFAVNKKKLDVRVSSIPTPYGESMVCRFLDSESMNFDFEELGFQGLALKKLQAASEISHGMILVTGPTGSGKTTTLYSILSKMKTDQNKIVTLEDPVEYKLDGVTQSQIDEKHGYNFSAGLRSLLRHDPNIVMLGEIRDLETAETAAQAALTGHVLLSTLHTNSAIESVPRLVNMGLPPFMVAPAVNTIIAQRLVRKVCPKCSTMEAITESEKNEYEQIMENLRQVNSGAAIEVPAELPKVHGCDACSQTGYQGRMVVAEIIAIGEQMKNLILNKSSSVDLIATARKEGMITMREDGYIKAASGHTTLEEVHRVTNVAR